MSASRSTVTGAALGLAWSAALRGWMVELAGPHSTFTWWTVCLVLAPGAAIGAVAGWATWRRRAGRSVPAWTPWSVALLAVAIAEPSILDALVTTGQGGGALLVAGAGAAGGVVTSRRGWSIGRVLALAIWVFGVVAMFALGTLAGPPVTIHALMVCLCGSGLVLVLGLGAGLTRRQGLAIGARGRRVAGACVVTTWSATLALTLARGWPWSEVSDGPWPLRIWLFTLTGGLAVCAVVAARTARPLPT